MFQKIKSAICYFSKGELALWGISVCCILLSFLLFDRENYFTLLSSLIGVTSLIFCAKGHPFGQLLIILFSLLYGAISFTFAYYGEMITYLGMTLLMAVFSWISWLKNPYNGNKAQVKINKLSGRETVFMFALTAAVTFAFYFILAALHTANLIPSTVSVATSFLASYLTFRRSAYYALAYALNDAVLIVLWTMAALEDASYLSVIICFLLFFINDIYGFISWSKRKKQQMQQSAE